MAKRLGIRGKLIAAMLGVCLIPLSIVGYMTLREASHSLESQAFNQLETVRKTKISHIEHYFGTIRSQVRTFSENRMIVEAMRGFATGFKQIPQEINGSPTDYATYQQSIGNYYTDAFSSEYRNRNGEGVSVSGMVPADPAGLILQYLYISNNPNPLGSKDALDQANDGSTYSQLHKIYHPIIRDYLGNSGIMTSF